MVKLNSCNVFHRVVAVGIRESILRCDYQRRLDIPPALFVFLPCISIYDDYVLGSKVLCGAPVSFLATDIDGNKNHTSGTGRVRDRRVWWPWRRGLSLDLNGLSGLLDKDLRCAWFVWFWVDSW